MPTNRKLTYGRRTRELDLQPQSPSLAEVPAQPSEAGAMPVRTLTYIIHSGFISGYQNRYGDNLKPPTNVYHRMTA